MNKVNIVNIKHWPELLYAHITLFTDSKIINTEYKYFCKLISNVFIYRDVGLFDMENSSIVNKQNQ